MEVELRDSPCARAVSTATSMSTSTAVLPVRSEPAADTKVQWSAFELSMSGRFSLERFHCAAAREAMGSRQAAPTIRVRLYM